VATFGRQQPVCYGTLTIAKQIMFAKAFMPTEIRANCQLNAIYTARKGKLML
jgi:hypothetical protein